MNTLSGLSDEELVLSIRLGVPEAYSTLTERFFGQRFYAGRHVALDWMVYLDTWRYNEVFFLAFMKAVETYTFRRSRLLTYYYRILERDIAHAARDVLRERQTFRSLEDVVGNADSNPYTLNDVVSSGEVLDDPAAFYRYAESLEKLHRLPARIDPNTMEIVRLRQQGYGLREIGDRIGLTLGKVRYAIRKYIDWAMKTFTQVYDLDEAQQKAKRKLLEHCLKGSDQGVDDD